MLPRGVWIPDTSTDPYGSANSDHKQQRRDESAYYTFVFYGEAVRKLRLWPFPETELGVPLVYYKFTRIIVDEIHESLCTSKGELKEARQATQDASTGFFTEKNRRAGRELLGISQKDVTRCPLVCRGAIFGLTGNPLWIQAIVSSNLQM